MKPPEQTQIGQGLQHAQAEGRAPNSTTGKGKPGQARSMGLLQDTGPIARLWNPEGPKFLVQDVGEIMPFGGTVSRLRRLRSFWV